jgi:hypothetical protein
MKVGFWIVGLAAIMATGCGQTHFTSPDGGNSAASLGQNDGGSSNNGGSTTDPNKPNQQPSDPAPGCQATYEQGMCKWALEYSFLFTTVADGATISGSAGNLLLKGTHVSEVTDFFGNLVFLGMADGSKIDHIGHVIGNVIVCHADIGILDQGSIGNVVVVGGTVSEIKDFTGNIISVPN